MSDSRIGWRGLMRRKIKRNLMQSSGDKIEEALDPRTTHLVAQFKSSLESAS